jgi:predicted secreted hydrolase
MPTRGTVHTGPVTHPVTGTSWLDREWSTSVLSRHVAGWDWLALQLDDATELMLYRLRRADGAVDPFSAATFIAPDGTSRAFDASEFSMMPTRSWRTTDGVAYPVAWRIALPSQDLTLDVDAALDDQELEHAVRYWEGTVRARGTRAGRPISGRGYLEMTGYVRPTDSGR